MKRQSNDDTYQRYWWISDHGRVKITTNFNDATTWPKLSLTGGHTTKYLALSRNDFIEKYVHRLVARFFIGLPPEDGNWTVDHVNGDKLDNHYTNLEWITYAENIRRYWQKRREQGKPSNDEYHRKAAEVATTRPREDRDNIIIDLYTKGFTVLSIIEQTGFSHHVVSKVVKRYRQANGIKTKNRRK
jgi:hypothetical protein